MVEHLLDWSVPGLIKESFFEFLEYVGVVDSLKKMCHGIKHPRFDNLKSFTKSTRTQVRDSSPADIRKSTIPAPK